MGGLMELRERVNDTVVQTRCDRRSLATILACFRNKGAYISSLSSLLRMIVEQMNFIVLAEKGTEEILSTEDATLMLKELGRAGLNPGERGMFTHDRQRKKEALFIEYGDFDYMKTRTKHTKEMKDKTPGIDLSPSVLEQKKREFIVNRDREEAETITDAVKRRGLEDQERETELSKPPPNTSKYEGGNAPLVSNTDTDNKPEV